MATLLHINSSILGDQGQSTALTEEFVRRWQQDNPDGQVVRRDLGAEPVPHLDGARVGAFFTDPAERNAEQQAMVALSDQLIEELRQADVVVLGVPMYNFSIPSQLKSWFDHLARAGVTFEYTSEGPRGLLEDRPVILFAARGGKYHSSGQDHQIPFVRQFLGLLGLNDVQVVYAEGLNMGDEEKAAALDNAHQEMDKLLERTRKAA